MIAANYAVLPVQSKVLGAIYGHLCGDACGVPYEFIPAHRIPATIEWGRERYA